MRNVSARGIRAGMQADAKGILVTITVQRARRTAQFYRFHELQIEYKNSLPADLRHNLPSVPSLEIIYDDPNAAFLAVIDQNAIGCVAVTRFDASTSVIKRF